MADQCLTLNSTPLTPSCQITDQILTNFSSCRRPLSLASFSLPKETNTYFHQTNGERAGQTLGASPELETVAKHKMKEFQITMGEKYCVIYLVCLKPSVLFTISTVFYTVFGLCFHSRNIQGPNCRVLICTTVFRQGKHK